MAKAEEESHLGNNPVIIVKDFGLGPEDDRTIITPIEEADVDKLKGLMGVEVLSAPVEVLRVSGKEDLKPTNQ